MQTQTKPQVPEKAPAKEFCYNILLWDAAKRLFNKVCTFGPIRPSHTYVRAAKADARSADTVAISLANGNCRWVRGSSGCDTCSDECPKRNSGWVEKMIPNKVKRLAQPSVFCWNSEPWVERARGAWELTWNPPDTSFGSIGPKTACLELGLWTCRRRNSWPVNSTLRMYRVRSNREDYINTTVSARPRLDME